jgi:hypothetical protein
MVVASAGGALTARQEVGRVEEGAWVENVVVRLGEALTITGVVRDGSGKPVAGVRVFARPLDPRGGVGWGNGRSGADGKFVLTGLGQGRYRVSARTTTGAEVAVADVESGARDLVLVVPAPGSISGRVVAPEGSLGNVTTVWVIPRLEGRRGPRISHRVQSEDGSFRIGDLSPGAYDVSAGTGTESAFSEVFEGVTVVEGQDTGGIVLRLAPSASIRCRAQDAAGGPLVGARVVVRLTEGRSGGGFKVGTTGTDGEYTATGLRPGTYRVEMTHDGITARRDDVAAAAGDALDLVLRLPGTGRLVILVKDESGHPLADALVHVRTAAGANVPPRPPEISTELPPEDRERARRDAAMRSLRTDSAGRSVREVAPEGTLVVRAFLSGYEDGETAVEVRANATTDATLVLKAGTSSLDMKSGTRPNRNR